MISTRVQVLNQEIKELEKEYHRAANSVHWIAVSKKQSIEAILEAYRAGQKAFGENYLQEALAKINALKNYPIEWHFIGAIQSNKIQLIAENFSWVHGLSHLGHAQQLSKTRSAYAISPLNICIQVNISGEHTKAGVTTITELNGLMKELKNLEGLRLRGLMTILRPGLSEQQQREGFHQLAEIQQRLNQQGFKLDTLSMGMSQDYPAAIAEGANLLRIGTLVFGQRN